MNGNNLRSGWIGKFIAARGYFLKNDLIPPQIEVTTFATAETADETAWPTDEMIRFPPAEDDVVAVGAVGFAVLVACAEFNPDA